MMFRCVIVLALVTLCLDQTNGLDFLPTLTHAKEDNLESTTTAEPTDPITYWVTYGKHIRPGYPMHFQVRIFKGVMPVEISIVLKDSIGNIVLSPDPVEVLPMELQTITVDIPYDIKKPSDNKYYYYSPYTVEVKGKGEEVSFNKSGKVYYKQKSFSIFIQTDKAVYKPSQKVQFRTLAMSPDMKVMRDVKQDIVVMDSRGNRILQYKGVEALEHLGVIQKSFQLASSVPLGKWTIKVTIEGVEEKKEFDVDDYVLPRFEVEVDGPPYGLTSDVFYEFTVRAKYTFGKPLTEGTASVKITLNNYYYSSKIRPAVERLGKVDENGELKVQVTLFELLELGNENNRYKKMPEWKNFDITANVTEIRTGKEHSGAHTFTFYNTPLKVSFLGITPKSFKLGLDFTAYIEVTKKDGTFLTLPELKTTKVMINVTYQVPEPRITTTSPPLTTPYSTLESDSGLPIPKIDEDHYYPPKHWYPRYITKVLELDQNMFKISNSGWVVVTFRAPDEANSITIEAKTESTYEDTSAHYYVDKSKSPTKSFLQLSVINKKPRVGDMIKVQAKATDGMKSLNYQIFSKGLVISSSEVENKNGPSKNLVFEIITDISMSPSMSIVAFYTRDDGELVVDALSLSVDGLFDNAVSIDFSKDKVKPGEKLDVIVTGEKDSVVFLLAVDKSVKLLKSGNDITQDMVQTELASYETGGFSNWRYMFICGWPSYFGGQDASSVFSNAGVVVLTDGLVYSQYNDQNSILDSPLAPAVRPVENTAEQPEGIDKKEYFESERTRKYFPENWLWKISTIPSDSTGRIVIPLESPDTITSWVASVFSVNPRSGLSVASKPAEVITFRNLFVSLDLPSSIVRYEDFCFPASVFSYYPAQIPVILTLDQSTDFKNLWAKKQGDKINLQRGSFYYSYFLGFMKENDVKTVTFCFTPEKIGSISIQVSAMTDVAGLSDKVERILPVKPEGFPHATTVPYLVTPLNGYWMADVPVQYPNDTVKGSEKISVNIAGNLLGPIFENMEDLLKKPYGCGEQNMINFSPIMSLLDFFFTTNTITDEFREKAIEFMLIGYQKEILYEHGSTGGYSTFGNSDNTKENPSMWLTAFVAKCFSQAELLNMKYKNILAMDTNLILRSVSWMLRQQDRDGKFLENGRVFNKNLQGGSGDGISLTSYAVIALHHASKVFEDSNNWIKGKMDNGLSKALNYLSSNLYTITDPYDICITTYALHLTNSIHMDEAFRKMEGMSTKGFGMTYWQRPKKEEEFTYYWSRNTDAINIEATSYALLTYSLRGVGETNGLPVIRWLSKQKGPNGGFISTQDTVIGIEALTSVAKNLYGAEFVPMTVKVMSMDAGQITQSTDFQVTKDNEMTLQRRDIPYKNGTKIELSAQMSGNMDTSKSTALVDVVFNYNVESETRSITYDMSHEVIARTDGFDFWVKIMTIDGQPASMTIFEMEIPAGFSPDAKAMETEYPNIISKTDIKENNFNVYINTDVIDGKGIKLRVGMIQTGGKLTKAQGKSYKVYNYYESEKELSKKYFLVEENFCAMVPEFGICQYE